MTREEYIGPLVDEGSKLKLGEFVTGTLIQTEEQRRTRSLEENNIERDIERAHQTISKFCTTLVAEIESRVTDNSVVLLMQKTFENFDTGSLKDLLTIAASSGRDYGSYESLANQLSTLETRYKDTRAINVMSKWLMIFTKENLYQGIEDILHLALCCFVKAPLEAPAESVGSIINQHGRVQRCSLSNASLSAEVQIAVNGPFEFSPMTDQLISEAIKKYFEKHTKAGSARFYVSSKLKTSSSTIANFLQKRSKVEY